MAENRYTPADWMAALPDLKKVGNEHTGPCPVCGGTDRFRVNAKGAFCRHECSPYPDLCKAVFGDTSASAPSTEKCWTCHSPGGDTAVHVRLDTPGKSKRVWWKEKPPQFTTKDFLYFPPGADREGAAAVICEGEKDADAVASALPDHRVIGTVTGAATAPKADTLAWGLIDATKVILWPDADDPGLAHMRLVAERLPHGSEALWANTEGLFDGQGAADCTLAGRQRRVSEAAHLADGQEAAGKTSPTTLLAALQDAFKLIEQRSQNPGALPGLSTGLRDLDDTTDGLIGGEVTVIAGRPSMGKTALALQIAEHVAAQDKHVLIASLEMSPVEIATRLLSGKSGISQKALRRGVLKTGDWRKLTEAGNSMSYGGNRLQISHVLTVDAMRAQCEDIQADLLVVDYLQLLGNAKAENRQLAVAEISRGLKLLAMERNMPIVAVSQLNREADNRKDHRPELSDLRESGAIEQDADVVLLLFRADYYNEDSPDKGTAKVIIAKNRNGETGTVQLAWRGEVGRFDNLARQDGRNGSNPPNPPD